MSETRRGQDRGTEREKGHVLLDVTDLRIEGFAGDRWHPIIDGVDLSVRRGEVLGIIGESGSGKSTLGLAAMGYVRSGCRIKGGRIVFDGIDLVRASEAQKLALCGTRIAYVAQSAAATFNPAHRLIEQTIEAVVGFGLTSQSEAVRDARELYGTLRLPNAGTIGMRYPHQVSGGQLQRVMTAMAMMSRPDLIVFDEPTTALDVTTQVDVLSAIRRIVSDFHVAALFITHDLAVVAQMADRIMVLRGGRTIEEAPTRQMLDAPKQSYTKSLWAVRSLDKKEQAGQDILLRLDDIEASYGSARALDGVSITVPRGRTVAIVGESGSGKSTTARVIAGLLEPQKGRVIFDGQPLAHGFKKRSRDQLRRIQLIYQMADTALNPRHTVWETLARPLRFYRGLKGQALGHRIAELLRMIELDDSLTGRLPSELSGGQKQRINIARALAADPDLIICDEVTSALDQIVQKEILKLLLQLQGQLGVTYIFITHDLAAVRGIADEVVVMLKGRVVEQGLKSAVLEPPFADYTKLLLSSVPEVDPDWLTKIIEQRTLHRGR